jgi:hypothetical protein
MFAADFRATGTVLVKKRTNFRRNRALLFTPTARQPNVEIAE